MATNAEQANTSKVSERLDFLRGRVVEVRVAYAEITQLGGETFRATFRDVIPMGREYFFHFDVGDGLSRLVRTSSVVSVAEIDERLAIQNEGD